MDTKRFKEVDIEKLIPYERNARTHSREQIEQLKRSIDEFGFVSPVIVDAEYNILAGHGRVMAAKEMGYKTVPCVFAENLSEEQKKAYIIADNQLTLNADWNMELLMEEITSLRDEGFDISLLGFGDEELLGIAEQESVTEVEDDGFDVEDALEKQSFVREGEIWHLGEHSLMCGDSTKPEDVDRLCDGAMIDLVQTDPPYNVAVQGGTGLTIANDDMDSAEFEEFLTAAFWNMTKHLKEGGAFYVWHASRCQREFEDALNRAGLIVRQQIIWNKNCFTLGRQDYQWKHELCFYGWKDGEAHYFINDRTQSTVFEKGIPDIDSMKKDELKDLLKRILAEYTETTVLDENKPQRNPLHPTMKPLPLIGRQIRNSSRIGETVLDLFGGSGTTLLACEQIGRKCRMMEFDPKYASVIVRRYVEDTGRSEEVWAERDGERVTYEQAVSVI